MRDELDITAEPAAPAPRTDDGDNRARWLAWLGMVVVFAAFAVWPKLSTNLGVEAPSYDKSGHEHVWRVWWRARNQIVDLGPSWAFPTVYVLLALLFIALSALLVWVALVPNEPAEPEADIPSVP